MDRLAIESSKARVMANRIWQGILESASSRLPATLDALARHHLIRIARLACRRVHSIGLVHQSDAQIDHAQRDLSPINLSSILMPLRKMLDCRLLWRFPPRRLEAESIRDSILAINDNEPHDVR